MDKAESSEFINQSLISKRRFNRGQKEYMMVKNDSKYFIWKKLSRSILREAREYDKVHKNILPYFPASFENGSTKVKIYSEDKSLKIEYNEKAVTAESELTKAARMEILTELNKMFPVQVFEAMYHQGNERKKVNNMVQEIIEEDVQEEQ